MKVLIKNNTTWTTRSLRPFVVRVAREEFPGTTPRNTRSAVTAVIGYNRGKGRPYCSGHAYRNSSTAYVNVPNPAHTSVFPVVDFCHVLAHEFGHCKGLKHRDMWGRYGKSTGHRPKGVDEHYAWALTLPPPEAKRPLQLAPDVRVRVRREIKVIEAEAKVAEWTRKVKLAQTKLAGWKRKLADRQRRMALPVAAERRPGTLEASSTSKLVEGSDDAAGHGPQDPAGAQG